MENEETDTGAEYLGAFNLNKETVQAAITDYTLKNSKELQEVVQAAEQNDQAVKVQVRWLTEGSFAEIHLFRTEVVDTETAEDETTEDETTVAVATVEDE
jgi:hypothetical protein